LISEATRTHTSMHPDIHTHARALTHIQTNMLYEVVQIWSGQTVTCLHTNRPGHLWTTFIYFPRQQLLCERVSILRCLSWFLFRCSLRSVFVSPVSSYFGFAH
jgi:hypothetical protein